MKPLRHSLGIAAVITFVMIFGLALLVLVPSSAKSQETTGAISGTVTALVGWAPIESCWVMAYYGPTVSANTWSDS